VNETDVVAYIAELSDNDWHVTNQEAVYTVSGGISFTKKAESGQSAPDLPGLKFASDTFVFSRLSINDLGGVAFLARLVSTPPAPALTPENGFAVFVENGGSGLRLVVRNGDPIAGSNPDYYFFNVGDGTGPTRYNSSGSTAFISTLAPSADPTTPTRQSVWRSRFSSQGNVILEEVARGYDVRLDDAGDSAPGTSALSANGECEEFETFSRVTINDSGEVAFFATTRANRSGIWVGTPGSLLPVVIQGQNVEIPTNVGGITGLSATESRYKVGIVTLEESGGSEDGYNMSFNDLGEVIFRADVAPSNGNSNTRGFTEALFVGVGAALCPDTDFDNDGDAGTDFDAEAFFSVITNGPCSTCDSTDVNGDGDEGTDEDIELFFMRLSAGCACS